MSWSCDSVPAEPLIRRLYTELEADEFAASVMVELAPAEVGVTGFGLMLQVIPAGMGGTQEAVTGELNPCSAKNFNTEVLLELCPAGAVGRET